MAKKTTTRTVDVAPPTSVEQALLALSQHIYQTIEQSLDDPAYGPLTVSPELKRLVGQGQRSTMDIAQRGVQSSFDQMSRGLYEDAARRGVVSSSFLPRQLGRAQGELTRGLSDIASRAQGQAAGQLTNLAVSDRQMQLQQRQLRDQMRRFAAEPQLLRDLMNFRLNTATITEESQMKKTGLEHFQDFWQLGLDTVSAFRGSSKGKGG